MQILVFTSPGCPKCPEAKAIVEQALSDLKEEGLVVPIENVDTSNDDGYIKALSHNIGANPSAVLVFNEDEYEQLFSASIPNKEDFKSAIRDLAKASPPQ